MITITGEVLVRTIEGRFGPFNVGTLKSDIGQFSFKDQILEELSEGSYQARCVIDGFRLGSFHMGNRMAVEMIASIYDVELLQDSASESEQHPVNEIDPLEEELSSSPAAELTGAGNNRLDDSEPEIHATEELQDLFGHLWPFEETVELDPTVDRASFRAQITYLKSIGYKYVAGDKVWVKIPN